MSNTKPDFFIVGAPKCGTTSLCYYLQQHPEIFISNPKEPNYFCPDMAISRIHSIEEYQNLFTDGKDKVCGEGSTHYLFSKIAPKKILDINPEAKIIVMLRDPVDFLYSWHSELLIWFVEDVEDFEVALELERERKLGDKIPETCLSPQKLSYRYLAQFSNHIERYLEVFPRRKIHFITLDDLKQKPQKIYKQVLDFLEVSADFQPDFTIKNSNRNVQNMRLHRFFRTPPKWLSQAYKAIVPLPLVRGTVRSQIVSIVERVNVKNAPRPPLDRLLKQHLREEFAFEVKRLSEITGQDLSHWSKLEDIS